MDKNQAKQTIKNIFTQAFDHEQYKQFLRYLLNHFEERNQHYTGNYITAAYKDHIHQYWRIGKYVDPNGEELDLLVVEVKDRNKLERARSSLRSFAVNRLKQFEKEASLIAFYARDDEGADWRFSFVKIEHEAYQDPVGKVKLRQELTPARRYSYLVGVHENSHTASQQLLPILEMNYADPRIDDIESAFSIEKVTDEFFDQYKQLFQKLAEHLKHQHFFQGDTETETSGKISQFAKKLLGQIVFLYFLQKKGWLGGSKIGSWGEGSKRFMRDQFDQVSQEDKNYYNDFLQYLFYEALANDRKKQSDPGYYSRFDCRVPFLNGGLFEAPYDWKKSTIDIPNTIFHNNEKNKAGDSGTGILDVFDRYNFTIKEDEPLEKEVAVDPEMLGKVFENMLEITERKNKGAFYTPREIVHYMCQESLIHYLDNQMNSYSSVYQDLDTDQTSLFGNEARKGQLKLTQEHQGIRVPREDLETLIRMGHFALENDQRVLSTGKETRDYKFQLPESVRKEAEAIDESLAKIKVCDPAIGSGAFLVGLLQEIINTRLALAPHVQKNGIGSYELKRHAIAESLYGVDTDASAIDIARLRLWLSLIVDEKDYDEIEALPNLDYKITQGDSLVGFPDNWKSLSFERIELLKDQFFKETNSNKKVKLKNEIDNEIKKRLKGSEKIFGSKVSFDFRLFFSEVWHENGGFDVVIGNPPYVQIQKFSGQSVQQDWEKQNYETFAKTGDIYCLFYEKGYRLLRNNGVLVYITSNKWMRANYGVKLRTFFLKRITIHQLIDFGDSPIFSEATTYTNIILFEKVKMNASPKVWDLTSNYLEETSLTRLLDENKKGISLFNEKSFVITSPKLAAIKNQIEEMGLPLESWKIDIYRGILTGFNEAFIIDSERKDELIKQDPKNAEIIKPILRGRDIKKYQMEFAGLWLISTFPALNLRIEDYPAIHDYLMSFGRRLHQTSEVIGKDDKGNVIKSRKKTDNEWFETQDQIAYYKEFEKDKIIYAEIVFDSAFYYDTSRIYAEATAFIITGENTKYLTAMLNSQLLTFAFRAFYAGGDLRGNTFRYKKAFLQNLPVTKADTHERLLLETLVGYVQITKAADQKLQATYFEQIIDGLVYELYFTDEIQAAGKEIYSQLGRLIPVESIKQEEEKLAVIQKEFDRLYDPYHPVRNNIETLDSIEVVKTIRNSLKK